MNIYGLWLQPFICPRLNLLYISPWLTHRDVPRFPSLDQKYGRRKPVGHLQLPITSQRKENYQERGRWKHNKEELERNEKLDNDNGQTLKEVL